MNKPRQHGDGSAMPSFLVFEVRTGNKVVYCCWSQGEIRRGQPLLTTSGQASLEALLNLPFGRKEKLLVQGIKLGETELEDKVGEVFLQASPGTRICFVGDIEGELAPHLHKAFNVVPGELNAAN